MLGGKGDGRTTRRRFLKALGCGALTATVALGGGFLGSRRFNVFSWPLSGRVQHGPLPPGGLYVRTTEEVLHFDLVDGRPQVRQRVGYEHIPLGFPFEQEQVGRIVAEGAPLVVYASNGSEIRAYNADLNPLGSFTVDEVADFGVHDGRVYALTAFGGYRSLEVVDFREPRRPQPSDFILLPTDKPAHHLLLRGRYAYSALQE